MINFLKLISRNKLALFGGILLVIIFVVSFLSPLLPLKDPDVIKTSDRFLLPFSEGYLLGTDHLGRDLLSRLLWGTRLSLLVGISAALISATIGSILGTIAGFYGNKTDNVIMRIIDVLMAFPYILLALAIVAVLGPGLFNAMIAVALVNIPFFARNIRGVTVTIANKEFIDAARLSGMSNFKIIIYEIFPNILPVIVVTISTTVGWMILETAGLSFLGLGSQPPQADLGSMLGEGRSSLIVNPHTSYVPGAMIFLIVIGVNLFGDGIRDALDPRLSKGELVKPQPVTQIKLNRNVENNSNSFLSVQNLTTAFEFDNKLHLASKDVSFDIKKGECLGLIGESGSGKSVTALSITCLVASPPGLIVDGSVKFQGDDILKMNNQVDSLALEDSRQDILELEQRISENVFQLELYKDFLSDDLEANQKLSVVKFAKSRVSNKNWSYSWVIVQRGREPRVSSVLIRAFVEGKTDVNSDDGLKEFPLNQLDEYLPRFPIQTRIKYFSINRGILSLPEGFEPIKIKFVLSYESSPKQIYESTFDWRGDL